MDLEELLIEIIKENCINSIKRNQRYSIIDAKNEEGKNLVLNLFYIEINKMDDEKDKYINDGIQDAEILFGKNKDYSKCFEDLVNHISAISNCKLSRIFKISSLGNYEKKRNEESDIIFSCFDNDNIKYFIDVRNNNDAFYRGFIFSYLIKLYENSQRSKINDFLSYLEYLKNANIAYSLKKCKEQVDFVVKSLKKFDEIEKSTVHKELTFGALYFLFNLVDKFESSLIIILREFVYKFIRYNPDFLIEDNTIRKYIENKGMLMKDYIYKIRYGKLPLDDNLKFILPLFFNVKVILYSEKIKNNELIESKVICLKNDCKEFNNQKLVNCFKLPLTTLHFYSSNNQFLLLLQDEKKYKSEENFSNLFLGQIESLINRQTIEKSFQDSIFLNNYESNFYTTNNLNSDKIGESNEENEEEGKKLFNYQAEVSKNINMMAKIENQSYKNIVQKTIDEEQKEKEIVGPNIMNPIRNDQTNNNRTIDNKFDQSSQSKNDPNPKKIEIVKIDEDLKLSCGCIIKNVNEFLNFFLGENAFSFKPKKSADIYYCPTCKNILPKNDLLKFTQFEKEEIDKMINLLRQDITKANCIICKNPFLPENPRINLCNFHGIHEGCLNFLSSQNNVQYKYNCKECFQNLNVILANINNKNQLKNMESKNVISENQKLDVKKNNTNEMAILDFSKRALQIFFKSQTFNPSCSCNQKAFIYLDCSHAYCIYCCLNGYKYNYKRNTTYFEYFCKVCQFKRAILFIRFSCDCICDVLHWFREFISVIPVSIRLLNNNSFIHVCPECCQRIENEKIFFIFTKYLEALNYLTKGDNLLKQIIGYMQKSKLCNYCQSTENLCFEIFGCNCHLFFICYSCLRFMEFNLQFLAPVCGCGQFKYSRNFLKALKRIMESTLFQAIPLYIGNIKKCISTK